MVDESKQMRMTAIAPWAGCKRKMALRLHEIFGRHDFYCAPFCGGLGEFLTKPISRVEILNDLHGDLTNLAKVIADRKLGPLLYRRLRRVLFCQQIHLEAQQALKTELDSLERAYLYFLKVWMSWGGFAGSRRAGYKMSIRFMLNGGNQAVHFSRAIESIPAWRRRLANVTILNMDGFKLLERLDDRPGTLLYCDPPYLVNSVHYEHDFLPLDHVRLAQALHRFRHAKVVVSYYEHPALDDLYPAWTAHRFHVRRRQRRTEVVLVNHHRSAGQQRLFAWIDKTPALR